MILIFSNKEDIHPNNVIGYLRQWGVEVFRLNTECLLTDYRFCWWLDSDGIDFEIENVKNGLKLTGSQVTAVWDRRASAPSELPMPSSNDSVNDFMRREGYVFLSYLRHWMKDIYSIGDIEEDWPAESKMLQLTVARELGMAVPDTCFANYREPIVRLAERYETLSLKSFDGSSVLDGENDREYVLYAQRAKSADVVAQPEEAFCQTANFVQNYKEKAYELRVTVVCDDVVACKIDSQAMADDEGKTDWRQGYEHGMRLEIVELPDKIADFCRRYLRRMKLNFGCFDFIVTPNGRYVFLECNPNGQWLWIELLTGYDLSKIVARHLCRYEEGAQGDMM